MPASERGNEKGFLSAPVRVANPGHREQGKERSENPVMSTEIPQARAPVQRTLGVEACGLNEG